MRIGHRAGVFLSIVSLASVLSGPGAWGVSIQNLNLTPNPIGHVPLSAALTFKTDVSCHAYSTGGEGLRDCDRRSRHGLGGVSQSALA